jgi:hypothetical protein
VNQIILLIARSKLAFKFRENGEKNAVTKGDININDRFAINELEQSFPMSIASPNTAFMQNKCF